VKKQSTEKRMLLLMATSLAICAFSSASAIERIPKDMNQNREWNIVNSGITDRMNASATKPESQPWKGGLFPVLFLTEANGRVGSDIAHNTGFGYSIDNLPKDIPNVLVYADVDSLKPNDGILREGLQLAKMNRWTVVIESSRNRAGVLSSSLKAALPNVTYKPSGGMAVSIEWKNGLPIARSVDSSTVANRLLPLIDGHNLPSRNISAKYAHETPVLPPNYTAYFAAAAFIDVDHVEPARGPLDHAHYSNPQDYIDYIFGANTWKLAHNDSGRRWDLWKTTATTNDNGGNSHPNVCIVSFRGTQLHYSNEYDLFVDLLSDVASASINNEIHWTGSGWSVAWIGLGFKQDVSSLRNAINFKLIQNSCGYTVVTGHSLGGALAQVFAVDLWNNWKRTGDGGYLINKFTPQLSPGRNYVVYENPFGGADLGFSVLQTKLFPYLGSLQAWNPIAPGTIGFASYYIETTSRNPNDPQISLPYRQVYCRRNDLALIYRASAGWKSVGTLIDGDANGCTSWAPAVSGATGPSYSERRKNHSVRNWFGLYDG
jgi:Lipase (class 3)